MVDYDAVNSEIFSVRNFETNACVVFASAFAPSFLSALSDMRFRAQILEEPFQLHVRLLEAGLVSWELGYGQEVTTLFDEASDLVL